MATHEVPEIAFVDPGGGDAVAPDGSGRIVVDDRAKGPAYAIMSDEQKKFLVRVARPFFLYLVSLRSGCSPLSLFWLCLRAQPKPSGAFLAGSPSLTACSSSHTLVQLMHADIWTSRIDPIVSPGKPNSHAHTIMGASGGWRS